MNFKQIKAIEQKNKEKVLSVCPSIKDESGIYILTRYDSGFKYAYVGQAKQLLTRVAEHLMGYKQHIDFSLKTHGFYSSTNPNGWRLDYIRFAESELDTKEQEYILTYANNGFQMRNKTAGGQGEGKIKINEYKPSKGYYDGVKVGYEKAKREIVVLFENYLSYVIKGKVTKVKERKLKEFEEFLKG